jgi:uncharacterized Fe-S cluster protein YjdI
MSTGEIIKKYDHGEIKVVWKPKKCIHSAICVTTLPNVYHPQEKPWIRPKEASAEDLIAQIKKCPSGALDYEMADGTAKHLMESSQQTEIQVKAKGPLLIKGELTVTLPDGTVELKSNATAFCRCGESKNKPYCDGTHRTVQFEG